MIKIDKQTLLELISISPDYLNFTLDKIDETYCLRSLNGMLPKKTELITSILNEIHGQTFHRGFCAIKVVDVDLDSLLKTYLINNKDKYNLHSNLVSIITSADKK